MQILFRILCSNYKFYFAENPRLEAIAPCILAIGASCAAGGMLLLLSEKKNIRQRMFFFLLQFLLPALFVPFFIQPQIKPNKMPVFELKEMKEQFCMASPDVHIVTGPSFMHAAAWVFKTTDIQTLNSPGEMDYADMRAEKENRRRVTISPKDFIRYLRNKNRDAESIHMVPYLYVVSTHPLAVGHLLAL